MTDSPSHEDVNTENTPLSLEEAQAAFLNRWKPDDQEDDPSAREDGAKDKSKRKPETPPKESDDEDEELDLSDEDDDSSEDQEEDSEPGKETIAGDDAKVIVKVDGEEHSVSVKDLKRLYGMDKALTRKSQEVAEHRKVFETKAGEHRTALETLVKRAEERFKPYANIDFLVASKNLDADELKVLRDDAQAAYSDLKFLKEELSTLDKKQGEERQQAWFKAAEECKKTLEDPEKGIKGWSKDLYTSVADFAEANGIPKDRFFTITDPALIKVFHSAMKYDAAKKIALEKKAKAPKKVLKQKTSQESQKFVRGKSSEAMQRLQKSGSREDAANAFLSRWQDASDD